MTGPGGTSPFEQVVERQSAKETKVEAQEGGKETRRDCRVAGVKACLGGAAVPCTAVTFEGLREVHWTGERRGHC